MFGDGFIPAHAGKQLVTAYNTRTGGLIPAHAGKTTRTRAKRSTSRAHPRSRGENTHTMREMTNELGSSPLTRGKRKRCRGRSLLQRLIPAHAGKTRSRYGSYREPRAHPRSRGENFPASWSMLVPPGSSPLTRGKHPRRPHRGQGHRLIPAHAGKTSRCGATRRRGRAHPRSRGENTDQDVTPMVGEGSSPLTRGKPGGQS